MANTSNLAQPSTPDPQSPDPAGPGSRTGDGRRAGVAATAQLSDQQLMDELSRRGYVLSAWCVGDLAFLDEDDDTEHLSDDQLHALKQDALAEAGRGLAEVLGGRGNEYLSDWWEQNKAEILKPRTADKP